MDSKIQQLTEAIFNEGVQKAKEEADLIVKEAQAKAAQIEKEAEIAAEKLINEAVEKSREIRRHVDSEIKMTVNQAVSAVRQEITSLLTMKVIQPPVKELFSDSEYLKSLILEIVRGWINTESFDLNLILPEVRKAEMERYFNNNLASELNNGLTIEFSRTVKSGFRIGPSDGSYVISFTDEDFVNFLKGYLRPKTSQILFEESR